MTWVVVIAVALTTVVCFIRKYAREGVIILLLLLILVNFTEKENSTISFFVLPFSSQGTTPHNLSRDYIESPCIVIVKNKVISFFAIANITVLNSLFLKL